MSTDITFLGPYVKDVSSSYFRAGADFVRALKELDPFTCRVLAVLLRHFTNDYNISFYITVPRICEELKVDNKLNKSNVSKAFKALMRFGAIIVPNTRVHKKSVIVNPYFVDRGYNHLNQFKKRLSLFLNAALQLGLITEKQMNIELRQAYIEFSSTGTLAEQNDTLKKRLEDFEGKIMTLKRKNQKLEEDLSFSKELMTKLLNEKDTVLAEKDAVLAEKDAVLAEKDARINDLNAVIQILSDKLPDGMARELIEEQLRNRKPDLKLILTEE